MEYKNSLLKLYSYKERKSQIQKNAKILKEFTKFLYGEDKNSELEIYSEDCFYILLNFSSNNGKSTEEFLAKNHSKLSWLLVHDIFQLYSLRNESNLENNEENAFLIEVGPRPSMITPFSTNAVSACHSAGIIEILRIEKSHRYRIRPNSIKSSFKSVGLEPFYEFLKAPIRSNKIFAIFGDQMTQCEYKSTQPDFDIVHLHKKEPYRIIDLMGETGKENLIQANNELGLGFDLEDIDFYLEFFRDRLQRNPTDVELFDMAQSNSEHSRHWFFKGKISIDGVERSKSLFDSIRDTQLHSNRNNVIAFCDNSSAINGFVIKNLLAENPTRESRLIQKDSLRHILYTAETHNFPTGVCPFPGAATGVGGRLRDVHATGRGAHEIAGVAGYSVGNLNLPGYEQPWENATFNYPDSFAAPLKILLEASDGASDYGNKFGEPLISGFTRSFGMNIQNAQNKVERVEYVKPIMFSGGIGSIDNDLIRKSECKPGQIVAKIGGPVYRIGVGGGAASSLSIQGDRDSSIDFGAVQRGDPEMEHKLHRVIRACVETGREKNPILSIHDQGAGGNGNVLKEIVEGENGGATIYADKFELGDPMVSTLELWTAEYQESDAILLNPNQLTRMEQICRRERCQLSCVGEVSGNQKVILMDFGCKNLEKNQQPPVNLDLKQIAEREPKNFNFSSITESKQLLQLNSLKFESQLIGVEEALELVLRLPNVASKRFLTQKVDRSVTGLIAQQQCCGPLQTPLADVAVTALSFWQLVGSALSIGEQPIKGLISPQIGARMSVGEALTNLIFAPISSIKDIKCSGNWMWAAKIGDEGSRLVAACDAMCQLMKELGIAVDGGKDSLSMAAKIENGKQVVKAPGTLVISAYAPCTDITKGSRLGGSALAQCLGQIGGGLNLNNPNSYYSMAPDLDNSEYFKKCFEMFQKWLSLKWILSGHDVSDGGLLTAILEGAFAGNCSVECDFGSISTEHEKITKLFGEELGIIFEVEETLTNKLMEEANANEIKLQELGKIYPSFGPDAMVIVKINNEIVIKKSLNDLREIWEETSDQLDAYQIPKTCLNEQSEWRKSTKLIEYLANFDYQIPQQKFSKTPKVAILREEGSNGDREMAAAFIMAGFEAFDLTMSDILNWAIKTTSTTNILAPYDGLALVGGFSYADVLGSAKGWAASIRFNEPVKQLFQQFRRRKDTFTLGVCNGCQLSTLLGFVGDDLNEQNENIHKNNSASIFLDENDCGRFYSGFNTVRIETCNSIFLKDMQDSVLGVWCSHGEGKFTYSKPEILKKLKRQNLISIRYCDWEGKPTQNYPENPNGSEDSVAGICSSDGRHLAIMPHPDRSFLTWQWPDNCSSLVGSNSSQFSPWMKLFQNAFEWVSHQKN